MFDPSRHCSVTAPGWNEAEVRAAIQDIVADARDAFDPVAFWPGHPMDGEGVTGHTSLYFGTAGIIWALHYLESAAGVASGINLTPLIPPLMGAAKAAFAKSHYPDHASLMMGPLGAGLVAMRIAPTQALADEINAHARANIGLPVRELMWGLPGSMLACVHMFAATREPRWRDLFRDQARRLMDELQETGNGPLWIQDLYGTVEPWLGPVHGFAGNVIPLLRGWEWLTPAQQTRIAEAVPRTLALTACRSDRGANWRGKVLSQRPPNLCQHCHGAAGMVTALADAPFSSPEFEALLAAGGELTWAAGPLKKGSNLCHGTGGNGYAFLKLYVRTGDPRWRDRARVFAMTSIAQYRAAKAEYGQGRYSLWTGDVGLAVYLHDCLTGQPRFPTIDIF